jgi:hypothetical protein
MMDIHALSKISSNTILLQPGIEAAETPEARENPTRKTHVTNVNEGSKYVKFTGELRIALA